MSVGKSDLICSFFFYEEYLSRTFFILQFKPSKQAWQAPHDWREAKTPKAQTATLSGFLFQIEKVMPVDYSLSACNS